VIHALVFDTDAPFTADGTPVSTLPPDARLAGLTLLRRAALAAWRAGASHVTLVVRDEEARRRWAASEKRVSQVPVDVTPVAGRLPPALPAADQVLILCAQCYTPPGALRAVLDEAGRLGVPVVGTVTGTPVAAALPAHGFCRPSSTEAPAEDPDLVHLVRAAVHARHRHEATLVDARHLASASDLRSADRAMYVGLTSVSDGWVDRVFNRRVSAWFTRRIINLPITPNQVTALHFGLGLLAAALFWQRSYAFHALGALLFQLSVALDCSDGEVARLKYQFSKLGGWLDVWADNVVTAAVFVAVARSAADRLGVPLAVGLGLSSIVGVAMCVVVVLAMARLQQRLSAGRSFAATTRLSGQSSPEPACGATLVDRIINEATSRDFSVIVVACALLGRLEWVAWGAGVGSHLFWMTFGVLQLSTLRAAHAEGR
jgi:phosphatidylglycerophosphate synthase